MIKRIFFLAACFCAGLMLGVVTPWVWWLDRDAGQRFAERQFSQTSRVYARALELHTGLAMNADDLVVELESAGLRPGDPERAGRFRRQRGRFEMHLPGFTFADGLQGPQRVRLELAGGRIDSLRDPRGTALTLVRMPPAELGSLLPLDDRDRTLVSLADFPPLLVSGIQAVEDRQFNQHRGLDPRGLLRAAWANLRHGGVVQGGSTITQQLVKNLYLTPERQLLRKFNEAVMAVSLERRFGKADILEAYLNEVYLGQDGNRAIHGFGRAAEYYFGLPVQALAADQIALLVGMARGASWYHPVRNPERAKTRRDQVLDMFLETGLIDRAERDRAGDRPLGARTDRRLTNQRHAAFLDLVARQLRADYRERDLRDTGLRVFTTLSPSAQQRAERALSAGLAEVESEAGALQGAIVLLEPGSGEVRALVGDRQPNRRGFNRALDARRSIGSLIKPFVYLIALAQPERFTLASMLHDAPLSIPVDGGPAWQPRNHDGQSHGEVALMDALAHSHNQATVALGLEVGLPALFRLLRQLGVEPGGEAHPSAFLGALGLTPLQVAQLYQPLAAEGYSTPLRTINEVVDANARPIGRYPMRMRPIQDREALALLDYSLRHTVEEGTARSLSWRMRDAGGVRGKTGTTNDRRDAWFVGYTRDWLGVVWTGRDDHRPAGVSGAGTALPIWASLFDGLPSRPAGRNWPEGIEWFWVDWPRPELADESCPGARAMPFIAGSQPESHSDCRARARSTRR